MMLIGIYVTEYCNAVERIKEKNETLFNLDPPTTVLESTTSRG